VSGSLLVGVDVGTTACKVAVVGFDGIELAHGRAPTPWRTVPTGAELDPAALLAAVLEAIEDAVRAAPEGGVVAVGVTSMAETGVLLDGRGDPVVPAIAWHDARGEDEARLLEDELGEQFTARTGLPPTRLCSLAKYRWLRANDPRAEAGVRWLGVAEWIVHALGGDQVAELSLASRTGFLDVAGSGWWDDAVAWSGAPAGLLPEPHAAGSRAGTASTAPVARAVLTVAGHDHLCAAVGAGATRDGDLLDSCGSAEAFVRAVQPPVGASEVARAVEGGVTVGWHVFGGREALLGGFRSGLALQRFLDLLGVDEDGRDALDAAAVGAPPGAGGLRVLDPTGEGTALAGIGDGVSPGLVWRAALEATQRHGAAIRATIEDVAGPTERLVVSGGWARAHGVRSVKREVLGPFEQPPVTEAGARGAALLAGLAAGVFGSVEELPEPRRREAVQA
jgi:sugar (pentulose or hexulose) kinase